MSAAKLAVPDCTRLTHSEHHELTPALSKSCRSMSDRRTAVRSQGQAFRSSSSVIMPLIASRPIFAVHRQISYSSFLPLIHVQMRHRDVAPLLLGHQKKRTRARKSTRLNTSH